MRRRVLRSKIDREIAERSFGHARTPRSLLVSPVKPPLPSPVPWMRPIGDILLRMGGNLWPCFDLAPCKQAPIAIIQRNGPSPPPIYPAEKAKGGEIILRTPLRRAIFIGGLLGAVILGLLLVFAR